WIEFEQFAQDAGLLNGSSKDWEEAYQFEWKRLDFEQKAAALNGLKQRARTDDPASKAIPLNYLKKRMWERRIMNMGTVRRTATPIIPARCCTVCSGSGYAGREFCSCEDGAYER